MKLTKEQKEKIAEANKHIPTEEIKKDIADTLEEINKMRAEAEFLEKTPLGMKETRWNHMRADARWSGIKEREEFIKKLQIILEIRGAD